MGNSSLSVTLLERIQGGETFETEFKRARGGLPKDVWPTVSAFANTNGGWIILGISEADEDLEIEGVRDGSALLKEFFDLMRNPQKISSPVCAQADAEVKILEGKGVVFIRVPAAPRKNRPVYINGNPYSGTYIRNHQGDYRCTKPEVDRMMRDAFDEAADSAILPNFGLADADTESLRSYRQRFQTRSPASPWNSYDDNRFLQAISALRKDRDSGAEGLTVAGLLLLGREEAIREWRIRHLIDYRQIADFGSAERWQDRVAWEGNLLGAFDAIYPRLVSGLPTPFRLDGATRVDESPAHEVFREALANLLVHADYAESQASLILRSPSGYIFRNPGNSRVPVQDLLAGNRSDPRNPLLLRMFRMIGIVDEAGTGIPKITQYWRQLGFQLPRIDSGTERYEFTLELHNVHLILEDDRKWLYSLGKNWTEAEQLALVQARHDGYVDNLTLRRLTQLHPTDATKTLGGLRDRGLLTMKGGGRGARYVLGPEALGTVPNSKATSNQAEKEEAIPPAVVGAVTLESVHSKGLKVNSEALRSSSEGLEANSEGLKENSEGLEKSSEGTGLESSGLTIPWAELEATASPAKESRYLAQGDLDGILVTLCARTSLSLRELATLTGRTEAYLRTVIRRLLEQGRLAYLFPDPRHPRQKYVAQRQPTRD